MILKKNILKQMLTIIFIVIFLTGCNKDAKTDKLDVDQPIPTVTENEKQPQPKSADPSPPLSTVTENADPDCVEFVALWAAGDIAERIGKDRKWVFLNYTVDLWDMPPVESEGNVVGKLRASSYARIIEKRGDDYKVESPVNQVQGWISSEHVKTTSWKNPKTRKLCK